MLFQTKLEALAAHQARSPSRSQCSNDAIIQASLNTSAALTDYALRAASPRGWSERCRPGTRLENPGRYHVDIIDTSVPHRPAVLLNDFSMHTTYNDDNPT